VRQLAFLALLFAGLCLATISEAHVRS